MAIDLLTRTARSAHAAYARRAGNLQRRRAESTPFPQTPSPAPETAKISFV